MRTRTQALSFDSETARAADPDETPVVGAATPPAGQGRDDCVPGDVRVIPVEVETTFVFDPGESLEEPSAPAPPEAVLLDTGGLSDVEEVLLSLGVDTLRIPLERDASGFEWPRPSRLLVASGSLAMRLCLRQGAGDDGFAALAISDEESRGFARRMREQGFQYVVNQPLHPELLRLLLQQTLYPGSHQRRALRYPVGRRVACRRGLDHQQATLVELSTLGGQLHVDHRAALEAPITLRVRGGDRQEPLVLRGRVVRCTRRPSEVRRFALGVAWDLPTEAERQALGDLLASPTRAARATPKGDACGAHRHVAPRSDSGQAGRLPRCPSELGRTERRRNPRAALVREIVALDTANRVCSTLVGCDISELALRVERHDQLATGQQLRIAIHTGRGEEPLVLESRVVRDDGARGLLLRFLELTGSQQARVRRMTAGLPGLEDQRPRRRPTASSDA